MLTDRPSHSEERYHGESAYMLFPWCHCTDEEGTLKESVNAVTVQRVYDEETMNESSHPMHYRS